MSGLTELAIAQPILIIVILAVLLAAAGWMIEQDRPALSLALRRSGYLGMLAAALLVVGQAAHDASRSDAAMLINARPDLEVRGTETRIPMAGDGHFWVEAQVNGQSQDFLIDTGATFTSMGKGAANAVGIKPDQTRMDQEFETANGLLVMTIGNAREFRFGNIAVNGLPIAVPRDVENNTNVIGMNLLSQLASWRVEGKTLVLVPKT